MESFLATAQRYLDPRKNTALLKALLRRKENIQNAAIILCAILSGAIAVAYAKLFKFVEEIFFSIYEHNPMLIFLVTPLLFLIAWANVYLYAPEASGSGIPQVLVANEINDEGQEKGGVRRFLSLKVIIIKVISSLACVLGGGAIGREGPTLQLSASLFYFVGEKLKKLLPAFQSQLWIISGASAGLAAAFNTPLGGIIFAIEELGSKHFHKIRTTLLAAIIISGMMAQWLMGNYLFLGYPKVLSYSGFSMVPEAIVVGALTGLAGGFFSVMLFKLSSLRIKVKSALRLGFITIVIGFMVALLIQYDPRAAGSGVSLISDFLFKGATSDLSLVAVRFSSTLLAYLSGAAGGIFSPSLAIGATMGSVISQSMHHVDSNLFVLLGMIGFLTGVTQTPFTAFILVLEMTDRHSAIFPMMITAFTAQVFVKLISSESFYEKVKLRYMNQFNIKSSND